MQCGSKCRLLAVFRRKRTRKFSGEVVTEQCDHVDVFGSPVAWDGVTGTFCLSTASQGMAKKPQPSNRKSLNFLIACMCLMALLIAMYFVWPMLFPLLSADPIKNSSVLP